MVTSLSTEPLGDSANWSSTQFGSTIETATTSTTTTTTSTESSTISTTISTTTVTPTPATSEKTTENTSVSTTTTTTKALAPDDDTTEFGTSTLASLATTYSGSNVVDWEQTDKTGITIDWTTTEDAIRRVFIV